MSATAPNADLVDAFIAKWAASQGSERANKDSFLIELCEVLGVPRPEPKTGDASKDLYVFERDVPTRQAGGGSTTKFIDLYKAGAFVLEAKQFADDAGKRTRRDTPQWHAEMQKAHGQALGYAKSVESPPPFVVVCDVGYCFDLYAQFDGSSLWRPFPNPQRQRIFLADLRDHLDTLRALFLDPHSLDPSKHAARITREVAGKLAVLAKELESAGHSPEQVATFLMRCLFTMFAEDVKLLPPELFRNQIEQQWMKEPARFHLEVRELWRAMDEGTGFGFLGKLLRFNGNLFKNPTALPLGEKQLALLLECARCDWSQVEPSIFGTLLERALSPKERHKLGAHYTPRAYVERLVRPTIEEPLRDEWDALQVSALKALEGGKKAALKKARVEVVKFHTKLCNTRVLDPACGTGNFLYVAFDLFKRLEGEVLALERQLTDDGENLGIEGLQISPKQFLGIEVKYWAKQIAELVLWIGYLQWHFRTKGNARPEEPVLRAYENIECRDAVLDWDEEVPALDDDGKPLTRWDGVTMKVHPVTGKDVPDDSARVAVVRYVNPRPAVWPEAEFVIGNPPFIGNKRMRDSLGDGYTEALRKAHKDVPGSVDFVMYWWHLAAKRLRGKGSKLVRFGFITTNSITQAYNRQVLQQHMDAKPPTHLTCAVPDHPWVDSADGAAVRIAMTVSANGAGLGRLMEVVDESPAPGDELRVELKTTAAVIDAALKSVSLGAAGPLTANSRLSFMGVSLIGQGFVVTPPDPLLTHRGPNLRPYVIGRDLNRNPEEHYVIDFFGCGSDEAARVAPDLFQRVLDSVRPQRETNNREAYRKKWWLYGEQREGLRRATQDLKRYVVTCRTAKHRIFTFVPGDAIVESTVIAIASVDAFVLGVLSSRTHIAFTLAAGGTLEDRPRYNNSLTFLPFPFPAATDAQAETIRALAEELDAHRKRQQAAHPKLTITGMYNVLEMLRSGEQLTDKERVIHDEGLVSVLKDLHDRLDAAVFDAYGWPADLTDEELIERLVALNAERGAEEKRGLVRWLRPEFQNPAGTTASQGELDTGEGPSTALGMSGPSTALGMSGGLGMSGARAWPKALPERIALVRDELAARGVVTAKEVAKALAVKKPADVVEVLDGLAMLGHAMADGLGAQRRWSAVG